jgi:hypothetical protein
MPTRATDFQQKPESMKKLEELRMDVKVRREMLLGKIREMFERDKKAVMMANAKQKTGEK